MLRRHGQGCPGGDLGIGAERRGEGDDRRTDIAEAAGDDPKPHPLALDLRQSGSIVMMEGGRRLLMGLGQGHPELDAEHPGIALPDFRGRAFRMGDAAARRHPIDRAGADHLAAAEAVAMHDLALEQICHRRQADMGMGADVESLASAQNCGAELIEEDEGADHPALGGGQHPADLEAVAQILDPGEDRHLDEIAVHGASLRGHGHGRSLLLG